MVQRSQYHRAVRTARLTCAALAGLAALALGCGSGSASGTFDPGTPDTLTVVTEPLPVAGFWEGTDAQPTGGLEFAMAQELRKRLGLGRLVVRTRPFSRIASGDLAGADLALDLLTPTGEREKVLDFTTPYTESPPALVTRAGREVPDVQTAQGLRWVAKRGTTFEGIIADQIRPDAAPLLVDTRAEVLDALSSGTADVAMFDLPAATAIVHDDPGLVVAGRLASTEPIAAALPKDSPNTEAVGSALRAMAADGTIDRLARRWLGTSLSDSANDAPLIRTDRT
jgi:ABC-type amino acid transport substrate-binding protein